jgi:hypothetical protein
MWNPGYGMVVHFIGNSGELCNLATGERWPLRPEDLEQARALASPDPTASPSPAALEGLCANGWAIESDDTYDEYTWERLELLDRRYAWAAPDGLEQDAAVVRRIHARRRHFYRGLGQYAALPETVARRVRLTGDAPKQILVLGDDDFLSVGLAARGHDVTVVELDPLIVEHLRRVDSPGSITVVAADLRQPCPPELRGPFDMFFADPLSAQLPLQTFLARGLAGLKEAGLGHVCVAEPATVVFEEVRRALGIEIVDHWTDFNHYYDPYLELSYYVSDMMRVRLTPESVIRPAADEAVFSPGMTQEEQYRIRPAVRYLMQEIETNLAHLIHLDAALEVLKKAGQLEVTSEQVHDEGERRHYVALTKGGQAIHVAVDVGRRIAELFVAPGDEQLEDALLTAMIGLYRGPTTATERKRVRGSTVVRFY